MNVELFEASTRNDLKRVKELLSEGADPNFFGNNTLYWAVGQSSELVKLLLQYGADPNVPSGNDHETPLHKACILGYFDSAKVLLENGADPNIPDRRGRLPSYWIGYRKEIDELLEHYSLKIFSLRSIRKHRINTTKIPNELYLL